MEKKCENCGNTFIRDFEDPDASCCSLECKYELSREREFVNCDNCNDNIELRPSEITENNFCSRDCYSEFRKGEKVSLVCEFCQDEFISLKSKASDRKTCSNECKYKLREQNAKVTVTCGECGSNIERRKHRASGNNYCDHNCYSKSKETDNTNWHNTSAHREWSKRVKLKYDECVDCGRSDNLQAHHIIPVEIAPQKANDISNGVALCENCHSSKHPDVPNKLFKDASTED
jgi:hypothetical protein